jgi:uroporphyrin-III C-methyltransferase
VTIGRSQPGKVYLIGAGPGDPELITLKGLRCLRAAEVILYDRLINPALLEEARPEAQLIFAGKARGCHELAQEEIHSLLIQHAWQGRVVARLKGGDPFVFGRGGEEAEALVQAGIPFEVVPGVSSAIAVPAYAGIPVTHRDHAAQVTMVSGHEGAQASEVDWEALATTRGTLVVFMGLAALPHIATRLLEGGMAPLMPVAVIQQGTLPTQRVVTGTLENIAARVAEAGLRSPVLIVIGAVVNLHSTLDWAREVTPTPQFTQAFR